MDVAGPRRVEDSPPYPAGQPPGRRRPTDREPQPGLTVGMIEDRLPGRGALVRMHGGRCARWSVGFRALSIVPAARGRSPRLQPWMYRTKAEALDSRRWPPTGTMIKVGFRNLQPSPRVD